MQTSNSSNNEANQKGQGQGRFTIRPVKTKTSDGGTSRTRDISDTSDRHQLIPAAILTAIMMPSHITRITKFVSRPLEEVVVLVPIAESSSNISNSSNMKNVRLASASSCTHH